MALHEWMRWEPTRNRRRLGFLVLTPARVAVGLGALLAIVAGFMPWAEGRVPGLGGFEPAFFSGLGGAGDGIVLILLAGGTGFLVLHQTPATSRVRLVHALPYVLIALAAVTIANGYRASEAELAAWARRGGSGHLAAGLWLAAAGAALMVAGGAALLPRLVRWERQADDPGDLMAVSARGVAEAVAGVLGVFVGGALGIAVAVALTPVPVMGLIALGAVFGGLFGAYGGSWAAGRVVAAIERARAAGGTPPG